MAYGAKKYTEPLVGSSVAFDGEIQVVTVAGRALTNGQVTVDTTVGGVEIVAAASRVGVMLANQGGVACYIGTGTVSAANGFLLQPGESVGIPSDSAINGITASGSTVIGYLAIG